MLEKELETAINLARTAGARVMEYYALDIIAESKIGADNKTEPVTIADVTASRIICENLAKTFPNDAILSEEEIDDAEKRLARKRVWMIDPIDGTWGFIKKDGDFGVQIGLTENGEAILGVVFLPASDRLFYAAKGVGAYLVENDKPPKLLKVSGITDFAEMILASSRNHRSPKMRQIIETFDFKREVQRGSVGLKVGLIAERICDVYIHLSPRTKFWDTCAPQIILEQAGGVMTDIFGAPLRYDAPDVRNHNGILASSGVAHDRLIRQLKPLLVEFGRLRLKSAGRI